MNLSEMSSEIISIQDFTKVVIVTGRIKRASYNKKARKPALVLDIDFGSKYGHKRSSAQLCENYEPENLVGTLIVAVMNFPPLKVAGIKSEVLVLAVVDERSGNILVRPDKEVELGSRLL